MLRHQSLYQTLSYSSRYEIQNNKFPALKILYFLPPLFRAPVTVGYVRNPFGSMTAFLKEGRSVDKSFVDICIYLNWRCLAVQKNDPAQLTEDRVRAIQKLIVNSIEIWKDRHPISCKANCYGNRRNMQITDVRTAPSDVSVSFYLLYHIFKCVI